MGYVSFLWIKFIFLDLIVFLKKIFLKISKFFKINVVKKAKKFDKNCRHSGSFLQNGHKIDLYTLVCLTEHNFFAHVIFLCEHLKDGMDEKTIAKTWIVRWI